MTNSTMTFENRQDEIRFLLEHERTTEVKSLLLSLHPHDAATALSELDEDNLKKLFELLSSAEGADILEYLPEEDAARILETLSDSEASLDLAEMQSDDAADVIRYLSEEKLEKYYSLMDKEDKTDLETLASYPANSAGALMTTDYLTISFTMTVKEAMKAVVKEANEQEMIDVLFVTDARNKLRGILSLKKLIIARADEKIASLMNSGFHYALVSSTADDAVRIMQDYDLLALPVIEEGILRGIITADDASDWSAKSADEDYAQLAGIKPLPKETIFGTLKSRLPWLVILLIASYCISLVMDSFGAVIASCGALVFFQSLILDMSGNAGTQSLAVTVVALSKDKIPLAKAPRQALKELLVGLVTGLILGLGAFFISWAALSLFKIDGGTNLTNVEISFVIAVSMSIGIMLANLLGFIVPFVLERLKHDPAAASGPLITTLNDLIAVAVYYGVAALLLGGLS